MPEHTSFLSYLVAMFPALGENMRNFGQTFVGHQQVTEHAAEPFAASILVMLLIILMAVAVRSKITDYESSVIPDEKLTLRTFFEIFIGYFYGLMKDMMGPTRAKKYFPVVGTAALFIFFGNEIGQIPGFNPPTSTWDITAGCGVIVLAAFAYYGLQAQGFKFITHLAGPWLGIGYLPVNILLFVIEFVSTFIIRPITISIRLMLNMAVDHLLVSISVGIYLFLLPIPVLILGTLVCIVQTLVFCLLTSIYIALATETHDEHGNDHGPGHAGHDHGDDHGDGEKAHA